MVLPAGKASPRVKPRDLPRDLRQAVACTPLPRDGQRYQAAKVWLLDAGLPSPAARVGGDLAAASEVQTAQLQHMGDEGRQHSHATFTPAAIQDCHRQM